MSRLSAPALRNEPNSWLPWFLCDSRRNAISASAGASSGSLSRSETACHAARRRNQLCVSRSGGITCSTTALGAYIASLPVALTRSLTSISSFDRSVDPEPMRPSLVEKPPAAIRDALSNEMLHPASHSPADNSRISWPKSTTER